MNIASLSDCALWSSLADSNPTWASLVELEPRLEELRKDCLSIAENPKTREHADAAWYGWGPWKGYGLKARMVSLVGWDRGRTQKRRQKSEFVILATLLSPPMVDLNSLSEGEQTLHSQEAYHIAYVTLCTACGCM